MVGKGIPDNGVPSPFYEGTVVAEAAFTIYDRAALNEVGGWRSAEAEDVLLTWDLLQKGWRIGFAEDACCFVIVPADLKSLMRQRARHARDCARCATCRVN